MIILIYKSTIVFQDITIESIIVQQARKDPANGQQDFQAYRLICFGAGMMIGGLVSSIVEQYFTCFTIFRLLMLYSLASTTQNFYVPDEIETNEFATIPDQNEEAAIQQMMENMNLALDGAAERPTLSFCQILAFASRP